MSYTTLQDMLETWLVSAEREAKEAAQGMEIAQRRIQDAEQGLAQLRRWIAHVKASPVPGEP